MENRIVLARFKDGYGPVGAYFLHLKTYTQNAYGDEYESKWFPELAERVGKAYLDTENQHFSHKPIPTCLRNHAFISEVAAGRGPIHMVTVEAFQDLIPLDQQSYLGSFPILLLLGVGLGRPLQLPCESDHDPQLPLR
jgi:hypothetical protein